MLSQIPINLEKVKKKYERKDVENVEIDWETGEVVEGLYPE